MKNYLLAALLLTASGTYVMAQDLESKQEMRGQTGKAGDGKLRPDDSSDLQSKQEKRGQTGKTANPEAQPDTGGLADKEKKDLGLKKSQ